MSKPNGENDVNVQSWGRSHGARVAGNLRGHRSSARGLLTGDGQPLTVLSQLVLTFALGYLWGSFFEPTNLEDFTPWNRLVLAFYTFPVVGLLGGFLLVPSLRRWFALYLALFVAGTFVAA